MTREEELDWLYRLRSEIYVYMPIAWIVPMNNAVDMAIKALKQYGALQEIRQEISQVFADSSISNTDLSFGILAIIDKHIKEIEK